MLRFEADSIFLIDLNLNDRRYYVNMPQKVNTVFIALGEKPCLTVGFLCS